MNKTTKYLLLLFLFFEFGLPLLSSLFTYDPEESTGPNDYARITDIDYKAELVDEPENGGNVVITEKITYDVHAASDQNLFWELWRDLPEDYVDGLKVDYQVNYVKQLNKDGTETVYTESPKLYWDDYDYISPIYGPGKWYHSEGPYDEDLANYECIFFYVDGLYREEVTFEIQYEMHNAALRYLDVSELYLTMFSEETIKYLESFKGQILIPEKDMPKKGNYLAHTYGTNSNTFAYTESDTQNPGYHTFSFDLDQEDLKFKNYNQYLEFSLLSYHEDRHIFTDYAPSNIYSNDVYLEEALNAIKEYDELPIKARHQKIIFFCGSILISIFLLYLVLTMDKRIRKKHTLYEPQTKIKFFRDIPSDLDPYFAAKLVHSKHNHKVKDSDGYSSLMLSLVRKGYIELQRIDDTKDWTSKNIILKILYRPSQIAGTNFYRTGLEDVLSAINSSKTTPLNNQKELPKEPTILELYNIYGKKLETLSVNEETYFNLLVRHATDGTIFMKDFQKKISFDYDYTNQFVTSIEKSILNIGILQKYFQKVDYDRIKKNTRSLSTFFFICGILLLTIGNYIISITRLDFAYGSFFILSLILLICAFVLRKKANKYLLFTQFGEDEYSKWRGLYNFLNSETLLSERTIIELPLWEKYLVYATAFGISDKVIKALKIRCPEVSSSPILSNHYYCSRSFRVNSRSFHRATHRASSISRGYHSHSYYGGGGRGGGGGGGGH